MHQQIEALQRQLKALQGSIGSVPKTKLALVQKLGGAQLANPQPGAEVPAHVSTPPYTPEVNTVSDHTTPPAALGAFEVEKSTAGACEILRQQTPFQS